MIRHFVIVRKARTETTRVFALTLFRALSLTLVATEHVGTHVTLGVRLLWFELSAVFALWDFPFAGVK